MQVWFWIWLFVVLKIPVVLACWLIWHVAHQAPEQVIGDAEGGGGVRFDPGPRKRGPHGGAGPGLRASRRGDVGHDEIATHVTADGSAAVRERVGSAE